MNWILIITSIVTAVAVLIYTVFAGLQWRAIKKQGDYASEQVGGKMQGQLDAIKDQADIMRDGLTETRKLVEHNASSIKIAKEAIEIANVGERAHQ